jgi:hypothetical protein
MLKLSKDNPFASVFENTQTICPQWLYDSLPRKISHSLEAYSPLIAYSFDRFIPIVRLRHYHYASIDLRGWLAYYFYLHQFMGFFLASLLIASFTGLTTK